MRDNKKLITGLIGAVIISAIALLLIVIPGVGNSDSSETRPETVEVTVNVTGQVTEEQLTPALDQSKIDEEIILPTPRADLESTDPTRINLASGKIQLVEAFAFW